MSDTHEGTKLQDKRGVEKTIKYIEKTKDCFFCHLGDEIEGILVDDKRYDLCSDKSLPLEQCQRVVRQFSPIKDKCLVWLDGNHPLKLWRFGMLTKENVCAPLGVPWGTYTSVLSLKSTSGIPLFKMFLTHGYRQIRSIADDPIRRLANEKLQVKQLLQRKMGDCLVMAMGHTHRLISVEPQHWLYLTTSKSKLKQHYFAQAVGEDGFIHPDHRYYGNTGGYLKMYGDSGEPSGYAEVMGLNPIELGYLKLTIKDRQIHSLERIIV